MLAYMENSAGSTGLKKSVFIPNSKKGNSKECSNYYAIGHISHASNVVLKIFQAWYVIQELPDIEVEFRKGRGTRE